MIKMVLILVCFCFGTLFSQSKIVIGIAGGTASGKTTLAYQIQEAFPEKSVIISQDAYYKSLANLSHEERAKVNFDHPDAIDFALLREQILELKNNRDIEQPIYNFCIHDREKSTRTIHSAEVLIVEGILLFALPEIRELFDLKLYVETDHDIRVLRRVERDMRERSRDIESIKEQYLTTVKPMHDFFVEPSRRYADLIVPGAKYNQNALSMIIAKINDALK